MESKKQFLEEISKLEDNKRDYLNRLFKYLPDALIRAASYKKIKKDQFIIHAGEPCETVYVVLWGEIVGLEYQKMGKVYYFMDFAQMYIIGDFEVFAGNPTYGVSICAATDCELLTIPVNLYWSWIRHDENALLLRMQNVMTILTSEKASDRKYMFMSCKERLMKYLTKSYINKKGNQGGLLRLDKTQAELSDRIGFNVRSVQRSIAALEKEKLIGVENGKITVTQEQFFEMSRCLEE